LFGTFNCCIGHKGGYIVNKERDCTKKNTKMLA
jgi:hypothetical protein